MFNPAVFLVLLDSQSFARLQDAFRESKRQVDKQRERMASVEASRKQLESDMAELQRLDCNKIYECNAAGSVRWTNHSKKGGWQTKGFVPNKLEEKHVQVAINP